MSAETKHTPGPWFHNGLAYSTGPAGVEDHVNMITRAREPKEHSPLYVACVSQTGIRDRLEAETNARLIAAAPELLEAAKLWAAANEGIEDYNMMPREVEARKATIAAIAKATGSAS